MSQFSLNLRFLLKRQKVESDRWAEALSKRIGVDAARAKQLLDGQSPSKSEVESAAEKFDVEAAAVVAAPIYGQEPNTILKENLKFLLESLPQGGRKMLAARLRVGQATISRWVSENIVPEKKNLRGLLKHFGLDPDLDLEKEPLFLSMNLIGGHAQKEWLINRVKEMPPEEISNLFAALERIFRKG